MLKQTLLRNKEMSMASKPNILVIWGDDIGISNLSCYSHGLMGYRTPNIDRLANEGMMFTDSYGEQSCTAGRSSFITGQSVYRTGLSKVGIPAAPVGMPDTIVTIAELLKNQGMYSTDNGPHMNTWPDGAMTPFRSEKNTNWEDAFRIPMIVRWPGKIKAGSVSNEIVQHHDWLPTFLAMAGEPDIVEKLKKGSYKANGKTFKNHIDGVNLLPYLTGKAKESPRKFFVYFSDDGDVLGMRFDNWKIVFMEQRCSGTLQVWAEPFTKLRVPKIYNLRTDPYERADVTSNTYYEWFLHHAYFIYVAQTAAAKFAATFKDFAPAQKAATFTIDDAIQKMAEAA
jgi:arylsulfatase A-like enzyme